MPNNCENDLWIEGEPEDVAALLALIGADREPPRFDFNALVPYPADWAALDEEMRAIGLGAFRAKYGDDARDGFNSGGYDWCLEHWGTKWNAYHVKRRDYEFPCVTFKTAWGPPDPVIKALHQRFPRCSLRLEWFERGCGQCGGFSCLAEDAWYSEDGPWRPGNRVKEWGGAYHGFRGG